METSGRRALGEFLRTMRERQQPTGSESAVSSRRTPGLRREEAAARANISVAHYINIERGTGASPSPQVLNAIARGLRLDPGQTRHLFELAGEAPPRPRQPPMELPAATSRLLRTLEPTPALVLSARFDVIAQNDAAVELLEDFTVTAPRRRNLIRRHFLPEAGDDGDIWTSAGLEAFTRFATAQLRRTVARYPDDEETAALVTELREHSPHFREAWARVHTGFRGSGRVALGAETVTCDVMLVPDQDQYVVFLSPDGGLQVASPS
ncbi:helix-turn-helix domain-containing protein [Actinoplanes rectilineatus]|uniref:helix-turn-helix domain-containing protein n=1 Tax=Actinoplanes rectilineatus TaxID=113571 RepID=UPI0005F28136|nr:helix-turn-helix transcriptional regulator [Actinoplanes rectilineatus]